MNNPLHYALRHLKAVSKERYDHSEIADLLEIDEKSLAELINSTKDFSLVSKGKSSYDRNDIIDWIETLIEQQSQVTSKILETKMKSKILPVYSYLRPSHIILDLKANTAKKAIEELISLSAGTKLVDNPDKLLELVLAREDLHPTAMGNGIAIPHPRSITFGIIKTTLLMIGISKEGIDFNAPDGKPVNLVVLIAVPDLRMHLQFLSRLASIFRSDDTIKEVVDSSTPSDLIEAITRRENEVLGTYS